MPRFRNLKEITFGELKHLQDFYAPGVKNPSRMKDLFKCWKRSEETMGHIDPKTKEFYWYPIEEDKVVYIEQ